MSARWLGVSGHVILFTPNSHRFFIGIHSFSSDVDALLLLRVVNTLWWHSISLLGRPCFSSVVSWIFHHLALSGNRLGYFLVPWLSITSALIFLLQAHWNRLYIVNVDFRSSQLSPNLWTIHCSHLDFWSFEILSGYTYLTSTSGTPLSSSYLWMIH